MNKAHMERRFESGTEDCFVTSCGYMRDDRDTLKNETLQIDALIEKIRKSIDLLREYRTVLISAAVTGKIDVRKEAV